VGTIEKHFLKIKAISISKAISIGKPLGAEGFIKRLEKIIERDILPKKAGRPQKESKKIREVSLIV
jgi:hypothetical protein